MKIKSEKVLFTKYIESIVQLETKINPGIVYYEIEELLIVKLVK